jgi:hypothetical protein
VNTPARKPVEMRDNSFATLYIDTPPLLVSIQFIL